MQRVGELMPEITPRLTTAARFRFNLTTQDALDLLTAAYQYEVTARHRNFILDGNTTSNLISLAGHITLPLPRFGIMCCGNCGNGKTTLMRAFSRVVDYLESKHHFDFLSDEYSRYRAQMSILSAKDIVCLASDKNRFQEIRSRSLLGIDDLGTEPLEKRDYGDIMTPIVELLEYRYDRQLFTFITTNLTGKEIRDKYKSRIADRFNEMIHPIIFKDITYRNYETQKG